jgi:glucosamine--fructose-6-phosphate aminotransferase (isomerizing)
MKYGMYYELQEQPQALKDTLKEEKEHMIQISKKLSKMEQIYLVGCGSSLSTCYSVRDAINTVIDTPITVFTGYEFVYSKKINNKKTALIVTSQSGETADTLASLRKANELGIETVSITNEKDSHMMKEAKHAILTRGGHEEAILGTKTYMTQLLCLYFLLFGTYDSPVSKEILEQLEVIPEITKKLLETTEIENKELAKKHANIDLFYCLGAGPNYGLAYKLAMTMFMEGAIKHACPLYSGEFRHGLIERVEKGVTTVFLNAKLEADELTNRAIEFCNKKEIQTNSIIFEMQNYVSELNPLLSPFILIIPLEWFVYYLAHYNNEDPGSTRHIGKVRY